MDLTELLDVIEARLRAMSEGQRNEVAAQILDVVDPPARPHMSDCARNAAPAYFPKPCDCGAVG